jgi:hypothetical protein
MVKVNLIFKLTIFHGSSISYMHYEGYNKSAGACTYNLALFTHFSRQKVYLRCTEKQTCNGQEAALKLNTEGGTG